MCLMTGESKYSDCAIDTLLNLSAYDNWSAAGSFLNTGNVVYRVAIAYDWLCNAMNEKSRETTASAIINNGVLPALGLVQLFPIAGGRCE